MSKDNINNLSNYVRYTGEFNTLHDVLKSKLNSKERNFGVLLSEGRRRKDKIINNYFDELDFHRGFRNILAHSHMSGKPPVAQPSDTVIEEIMILINKIKSPKKAFNLFKKDVKHFNYDDGLGEVLKFVNENQYSQFPVFEGNQLKGLITENGITQFLSRSVKDDIFLISETNVSDVITLDEAKDSWEIVSSNALLIDIKDVFSRKLNAGNSLFAILISNRGTVIEKPEDIIGIITPWDLPEILKNI